MPAKKDQTKTDDIFDQTAAPEGASAADSGEDGTSAHLDPIGEAEFERTHADAASREAALAAAIDSGVDPFAGTTEVAQHSSGDGEDADLDDGDFFINMAKADEKIKPMEIGTRLIVSCNAADAKISGTGNPMIALRVKAERVVSTPNASTDTRSYKNRAVRDNLLFIPPNEDTGYKGTIWRANQAMRAFGVEPDHGEYRSRAAFMEMLRRKADELRGAVAEIEVGIEWNDGSDGRAIQVDPSTGLAYDAKNTIVRYYAYTPPAPVSEASIAGRAAGASDNDDLPF